MKSNVKKDVKFDFKIKGQKPIVTKDVCQFNITGAGFKEEKLVAFLKDAKIAELEWKIKCILQSEATHFPKRGVAKFVPSLSAS